MKKYLFVTLLLFISYFATSEIYSCPYTIDGEADLLQIERIDEKTCLDLIYPNEPPWKIFYENNYVLTLTTTFNLEYADDTYELWILVLNKKSLTYQWATLNAFKELPPYPVIKGKCFVK